MPTKKSKTKPKKKMKSKAKPKPALQKVEIDLNIRSEHPSLPAPATVDQIRAFAPEISKRLKKKYGVGSIEVERQKTFPFDPLSILVTIAIYVGLKAADKLIEKITEDVYTWVKEELSAGSVTKAGKHRTSKTQHS